MGPCQNIFILTLFSLFFLCLAFRVLQEKQAADKQAAKESTDGSGDKGKGPRSGSSGQAKDSSKDVPQQLSSSQVQRRSSQHGADGAGAGKAQLGSGDMFAHLQSYDSQAVEKHIMGADVNAKDIPECVFQLALKFKDWTISGSNARCIAMLGVLRRCIEEHESSSGDKQNIGKQLLEKVSLRSRRVSHHSVSPVPSYPLRLL